jgi:transcriptional regulator with XRE-family HTH domain
MLGEALRLIRVYHDLKQTDAAAKLGISKSYLSEIESGTKEPTLQLVQRYAEAFDLPPSSILFFAENVGQEPASRARRLVAGKILSLMRFLEDREHSHGNAT